MELLGRPCRLRGPMSCVCILTAPSRSPPVYSHFFLGPKCHSLNLQETHLLPTSIFQLREAIPRERHSRNWPGPSSLCIDVQDPSWWGSRDKSRLFVHSPSPAQQQAGIQSYLFAFGGPRSQRTNIRILQKFSHSDFSYPQGLGAGASTYMCTHTHRIHTDTQTHTGHTQTLTHRTHTQTHTQDTNTHRTHTDTQHTDTHPGHTHTHMLTQFHTHLVTHCLKDNALLPEPQTL